MPAAEKAAAMARFAAGEADVLVATSVIEVGIDVPNATVMLIEEADRYGLSQLHQLRGRVGRGEHETHCILFADPESERAQLRLDAIASSATASSSPRSTSPCAARGRCSARASTACRASASRPCPEDAPLLAAAREDVLGLVRDATALSTRPNSDRCSIAARARFGDERSECRSRER